MVYGVSIKPMDGTLVPELMLYHTSNICPTDVLFNGCIMIIVWFKQNTSIKRQRPASEVNWMDLSMNGFAILSVMR